MKKLIITPASFRPVFDDPPKEDLPKDDLPEEASQGTFTQEQVNAAVAKERREAESKSAKRISSLEGLRDEGKLDKDQLDAVNQQLEDMRSDYKTKEQLASDEKGKTKKNHDKALKELSDESSLWKGRYTAQTINNAIIAASVVEDAFDTDQVVALLSPSTRLVDEVDEDSKKTGKLIPRTKFKGLDSDGKEVELDLAPAEIVKRMSGMDKYFNLFKGKKVSGLGGQGGKGGKGGVGDLTNTANYLEQRKKGNIL